MSEQAGDHIVQERACPACGAAQGVRCTTVIEGKDTGWTHDARVYAAMGVRRATTAAQPASQAGEGRG